MKYIKSIQDIIPRYDLFLFDIVGVIHDGLRCFPHVNATLSLLNDHKKMIAFVSNTPRPYDMVSQQLLQKGLLVAPPHLFTSGDAFRYHIIHQQDDFFKKIGRHFYHLGAQQNQDILKNLTIKPVEKLTEADFLLNTVFTEQGEDTSQFDAIFHQAMALNLPMIVANPDIYAIQGDMIRCTAGFYGERYKRMGGEVIVYGKPDKAFYDWVLSAFPAVDKQRTLMIGDTLETDALGAKNAHIDMLLVLTGNAAREAEKNSGSTSSLLSQIKKETHKQKVPVHWVMSQIQ